jgi:[lysine-biosynthesis-protein LysW]--L-2-aminoadipate ligase
VTKIGVLCSLIRVEEKLILKRLREREIAFDKIDVREVVFDLHGTNWSQYDAVLIRCLSQTNALYAARALEMEGVKTVNPSNVIATCGDKILTTLALNEAGIPNPQTHVAFDKESALAAVDAIGYPAVIKPPVGSWGRMMAKVNDREAAEAIVEHKLSADGETPLYVQAYVDKPGRDIRALVVGDEIVYAIYRSAKHWITNTARGGTTTNLPLTPELEQLCHTAANAVGGGIVAVDVLEDAHGRLMINEVNNTPEFHGAMEVVDVDIAGKIVDHVLHVSRQRLEIGD